MGLSLDRVSHAYDGRPILRGVTFSVAPGEVACLLGPSGCGKTTLLRVVAGLERLDDGQVAIGGRSVADAAAGLHLPPERRRVGLMFQDYALFPHLSVVDNVAFGLAGRDGAAARMTARAALARLGLEEYAECYPHMLSSGQQQRCALLRALLPAPQVLLLDEPFSALDASLRAAVRDDTLRILREAGVATLIVTHDPEEAMAVADRIGVMAGGRLLQHGTPADLYLKPASGFVATLLGPVNRLRGRVAAGAVETPLGRFPAGELAEGAAVELLFRPESLLLNATGDAATATVLDARLLGRASRITLALAGLEHAIEAVIPAVHLPPAGTTVRVKIEPGAALVLEADQSGMA
ncbi:MAG TPA: ABC transporter ATP-binding protein [Ferrovibrio sp.]|uniref:ABC transporter ATP-binding protein n=1 Tax=Ferrovibrio sp. TaxID=1917215 RepID=UPI002ED1407D